MQIARFAVSTPDGPQSRVAVAADAAPDSWIDARTAHMHALEPHGATPDASRRIAQALIPGSLSAGLAGGETYLDALREAAAADPGDAAVAGDARLVAPIDPIAYRDFMAFESHFVEATRRIRGPNAKPADVLYELPVSISAMPTRFSAPTTSSRGRPIPRRWTTNSSSGSWSGARVGT